MRILVNAASRMVGGAIAVTDSICSYLNQYLQHSFVVVLSPDCQHIGTKIQNYNNVKIYYYYERISLKLIFLHKDNYLDYLVSSEKIDAVFNVFEPFWKPSCPMLAGFAQPHIVYNESPYFKMLTFRDRIINDIVYGIKLWCIKKTCSHIYTENPEVSKRLQILMPKAIVYTVTSYYHQIYDMPEKWQEKKLPVFKGTTLLTIAMPYPHKNLPITVDVAKILIKKHPDFNFRFIMTLKPEELVDYDNSLKNYFEFIGRIKIEECPSLYAQSDIMWMPTLLECFSGTYAEAMKMKTPIITTDMGFASGCCGRAAKYYSPLSAEEAADAIYEVSTNKSLYNDLVANGLEQLKMFNNSEERASMMIQILEDIANKDY